MKLKIALALSAFALSSTAFGEQLQNPIVGVYFGAEGGASSMTLGNKKQTRTISGQAYTFDVDKTKLGGNIHMGNFWGLNNNFSMGMQIGATYWGQYNFKGTGSTDGKATYDQMTLNFLFVAQLNFNSLFFVQGLVGPAMNMTSHTGKITAGGVSQTAEITYKLTPLVGVHLGWNATPNLSVYAYGSHLMGSKNTDDNSGINQRLAKATQIGIGLNYNIGQ